MTLRGSTSGQFDSKPEQPDPKRLIATDFATDFVPFPDGDRGAILFYRDGTLLAQPFDLRHLETVGEATPVAEPVCSNLGFGFFSASVNGTLVYRGTGAGDERLDWLDRQGNRLGTVGELHRYLNVAISPDGTRAAAARIDSGGTDIWLTQFAHASDTRFTFDPTVERGPVWSPDGSRIVFSSNRSGQYDLYQHASNGSGQDELLFKSDDLKRATDWSRDGRYLLYDDVDPKTKQDLWVLTMDAASNGRNPFHSYARISMNRTENFLPIATGSRISPMSPGDMRFTCGRSPLCREAENGRYHMVADASRIGAGKSCST